MKINNSKFLLGLAVVAGLIVLSSSFKSGASKKYTTMVVTRLGIKANVAITIVSDGQKTEPIELASNNGYENIINNTQAINQSINKLSADGYRLVQVVPDNAIVTNYFFEKE